MDKENKDDKEDKKVNGKSLKPLWEQYYTPFRDSLPVPPSEYKRIRGR